MPPVETHHVPHVSVQDGDDLLVSFALGRHTANTLGLLRTPKYEHLAPADQHGVSISPRDDYSRPPEMLVALRWGARLVTLKSNVREVLLDISAVDPQEIAEAKSLLEKMNFDQCFQLSYV